MSAQVFLSEHSAQPDQRGPRSPKPAKRLSSTSGITGPPRLKLHLKTRDRRLRVHAIVIHDYRIRGGPPTIMGQASEKQRRYVAGHASVGRQQSSMLCTRTSHLAVSIECSIRNSNDNHNFRRAGRKMVASKAPMAAAIVSQKKNEFIGQRVLKGNQREQETAFGLDIS